MARNRASTDMISKQKLQAWIDTLPSEVSIAVDDGGTELVALEGCRLRQLDYLEIGGVPNDD